MTRMASLLAARLVFELEHRDLSSTGTCTCGRPRDRFMTPKIRKALDEFVAAIAEEPDTPEPVAADPNATRTKMLEVD